MIDETRVSTDKLTVVQNPNSIMSVLPVYSLRNKAEILIVKTGKTVEKGSMLNMYIAYMFL